MGRTKVKKNVRTSNIKVEPLSPVNPQTPPTTASIFEKAKILVTQCNYDLAHKFLVRVLEQEPNHTAARELLGEVCLEMGELEDATQMFESLLPPSPYAPFPPSSSAYLNLAQLCEDPRDALRHYQAAADILLAQLKGKDRAIADQDDDEVKAKAVGALVAMVEIWMSDLCFEEEAEATSDNLATLALQTDPTSCEALQTLASVRMSQKRPEEAQECAERAWEAWKDLDPDSTAMPSLPVRLSLTRLFLELSLFAHALSILSGVLAADDQEVEAWYLEGWCFYLMAEQARETEANVEGLTWEELARDARACLDTCQMLHQGQEHSDELILQHVREIISELTAAGVGPSPESETVDEGGDEDDTWEDEEGDVEME
ncbi:TPR-like protein [Ramaria rubella]|nr:TPR-like protein [Ramaria rubella]